jgi:hypothetical protein
MQRNTRNGLRFGAVTLFVTMMAAAVVNAQGCAADPSPPVVQAVPEQVAASGEPAEPADPTPAVSSAEVGVAGSASAQTAVEATASAEPEEPPAFMGATKSGGIFHPQPAPPAQQQNAAPQQQNAAPPRQTP